MAKSEKIEIALTDDRRIEDELVNKIAGKVIPPISIPRRHVESFEEKIYRIPLIGKKALQKKVKKGFVVAEVIRPNRNSSQILIDTRFNAFSLKIDNNKEKLFVISPLKERPEDFIKFVDQIPTAIFDWRTGKPVPITDAKLEFDDDYYNDIVMRARLVGGTERLVEWLNQMVKKFNLVLLTVVGHLIIFLAVHFGWL